MEDCEVDASMKLKKIDEEILKALEDRGKTGFTELVKEIEGRGHTRITFVRHLKDLVKEGLVEREVKPNRTVDYSISDDPEARSKARVCSYALNMIDTRATTLREFRIPKIEEALSTEAKEDVLSSYRGLCRFLAEPALKALSESMRGVIISDLNIDEAYLFERSLGLAGQYLKLIAPLIDEKIKDAPAYIDSIAEKNNLRLDDVIDLFGRLRERVGLEGMEEALLTGEGLTPEERHLIHTCLRGFIKDVWGKYPKWIAEKTAFQLHVTVSFDGKQVMRIMLDAIEKTSEDTLLRGTLRCMLDYLGYPLTQTVS